MTLILKDSKLLLANGKLADGSTCCCEGPATCCHGNNWPLTLSLSYKDFNNNFAVETIIRNGIFEDFSYAHPTRFIFYTCQSGFITASVYDFYQNLIPIGVIAQVYNCDPFFAYMKGEFDPNTGITQEVTIYE